MTDASRRQRIEDLCDAALDRDPHERAAFLTHACENDDALREEVERLLSHANAADDFLAGQGVQIARAGLRQRLATISVYQDHVAAGCLMSYGQNVADFHRQAARYVDRILKGATPGDLPVEQPTKFEFTINIKTATVLGLDLPRALLASADNLVE